MTAIKVNIIGTGTRYIMESEIVSWWDPKEDSGHGHDHSPEEMGNCIMQIKQTIVERVELMEGKFLMQSHQASTQVHLTDTPQSVLDQLNRSRR